MQKELVPTRIGEITTSAPTSTVIDFTVEETPTTPPEAIIISLSMTLLARLITEQDYPESDNNGRGWSIHHRAAGTRGPHNRLRPTRTINRPSYNLSQSLSTRQSNGNHVE